MSLLFDLERFTGEDTVAAEEAFVRMTPMIERFLHRYLSQMLPKLEDREDVVSATLSKLWQRRTSFRVQGLGPWWSYVGKCGRRAALTKLGEPSTSQALDEDVIEESTGIDFIAVHADDRRRLYEAADRFWLNLEADLSSRERKRRLLAAQLVFLHKVPAKSVLAYLGNAHYSREEVDDWLASEPALLDLAYHHLFWENGELTEFLLDFSRYEASGNLRDWIRQAERRRDGHAPNGMSWDEVSVVIWKFYFGMSLERILVRAPEFEPTFVENVLAKAEKKLPHCDLVRRLAESFSVPWIQFKPLTHPGLWKRLVFQYCVHSGLPQKQIFQYTQPPAALVGHRITPGMLNVWLSNGRLFSQLASFAQDISI